MKVILARSFLKNLRNISPKVVQRFKERCEMFAENPFNPSLHNHKLHGEYAGYWSINVTGNYRAVYRLVEINRAEFFTIDTHSNLYGS